jgi:hypothetical protein
MAKTCLFTGQQLTAETHIEHVIPECLCGRLTTREVSCDEFNGQCGAYLDNYLRAPYALLINRLGPLLPAKFRSGNIDVDTPNDPPGLALDGQGCLTRKNVIVETDAQSGKRSVTAANEQAARKVLRQLRKTEGGDSKITAVPVTTENVYYHKHLAISAEIELAALKSCLLTFDHLLSHIEDRFTRSPALQEVRDFVRDSVKLRAVDSAALHRFSLGLQYEKLGLYWQLRNSLAIKRSPFEHVLMASGNAATRTIDIVWLIFEFDPHGFRVCDDWRGLDFTWCFVNGVLKDTTCSEAIFVPGGRTLCRPTDRRSIPNVAPDSATMERITSDVSVPRRLAIREAIKLVENSADDFVIEAFTDAAKFTPDCSMTFLVRDRLKRLWNARGNNPEVISVVETELSRLFDTLSPTLVAQSLDASRPLDVEWPTWLGVYRKAMAVLEGRFGLPGDVFVNEIEVGLRCVDNGLLGDGAPTKPSSIRKRDGKP